MSGPARSVAAVALMCCLAASALADEPAAILRAPHPEIVLPESGTSGQEAIDLLGEHLAAVAAAYGKTPEELRRLLLSDRTARIDGRDRLYYVDDFEPPRPAPGGRPASTP